MHQLIIDSLKLTHEEWQALCAKLYAESYAYSSVSSDKKVYVECASVSQIADVVDLIRNITDLN